ncbi:uncharacterized protein LOC114351057 isoform X2 [Ostrinia furnacalis]|uniref:uncharacterized protein LOC114351057 isoform X2 n=1 Tax=Ostrinia furnacalis TaxID=93504 RepID=UPI001040107B|nr:uncharacterized protein LOC114351057 isoform X2 [Ostrinia furnacalis]
MSPITRRVIPVVRTVLCEMERDGQRTQVANTSARARGAGRSAPNVTARAPLFCLFPARARRPIQPLSDKQTSPLPSCQTCRKSDFPLGHRIPPSCICAYDLRSTNVSLRRRRNGGFITFWKMTEGLLAQHDKPMCVRIWLEVGHACEPRRSALGRALALDWRLWVRGASGRDISAFVHKVVFHLHPSSAFVYPKRVLQEPPYEIQESGTVSIDIPIHVYLKYSSEPKKIRLRYSLEIENHTTSSTETRHVYYDVESPPEPLCRALMRGGGQLVARAGRRAGRLLVLADAHRAKPDKTKKYKFVEPVPCKHPPKRVKPSVLEEICPKCGESTHADFRKQLRSVGVTEDEVGRVSQLYLAYSSYEKAADALPLPPLADPLYRPPELSPALREALKTVQIDFMIQ